MATLGEQGQGIVLTVLLSLPLVPGAYALATGGSRGYSWVNSNGWGNWLSQLPLPSLPFTLPPATLSTASAGATLASLPCYWRYWV